mgnify:CR=1 FL=1
MRRLLPYIVKDGTKPKKHALLVREQKELRKSLKMDLVDSAGEDSDSD